ncbi:class I SAM-dependent methyltransferase [Niabella terrae]
MIFPPVTQTFDIGESTHRLWVPDPDAIAHHYRDNKQAAYWARVWPAAIGLSRFLKDHPDYITGRNVLELGAGMGLPGISIADQVREIRITDIEPLAIPYIRLSAAGKAHVHAQTMDWRQARETALPETLLFSDVNYDPAVFDELESLLRHYIERGIQVLLSTPQRLVARDFVNRLSTFYAPTVTYPIDHCDQQTQVSVFAFGERPI